MNTKEELHSWRISTMRFSYIHKQRCIGKHVQTSVFNTLNIVKEPIFFHNSDTLNLVVSLIEPYWNFGISGITKRSTDENFVPCYQIRKTNSSGQHNGDSHKTSKSTGAWMPERMKSIRKIASAQFPQITKPINWPERVCGRLLQKFNCIMFQQYETLYQFSQALFAVFSC